MKHKILPIVIAVFVIVLLGFLSLQTKSNDFELKVGFVLPITGDAAVYGESAQKAAQLAVEHLAIKGVEITPIYEDSQLSGEKAASAAQKLINIDRVQGLVTFSSGETLAVCPISEKEGITLFSSASSPEVSNCGENTFRNYPSDIYQGTVLADKAREFNYDKVALVYINNDYGVGLKTEFLKNYPKNPLIEEALAPRGTDFRTQIAKIKESGAQQIVLIALVQEGSTFLNQANVDFPILASEALKDDSFIKLIPESLQDNMRVISAAEYVGLEAEQFKNAYTEKYQSDPAAFADYVYDNTIVLGNALHECKDNRNCIKKHLDDLKYTGATGPIEFDTHGDVINKEYEVFEIEDGKFVGK